MPTLSFEHYLKLATESRLETINEGMGNNLKDVAIFSALLGSLASAGLIVQDKVDSLSETFNLENETTFQVGKHKVTVKVGDVDKIIYTSFKDSIMTMVPQTMDKDDATQQIEEIIMKIKRQGNIK